MVYIGKYHHYIVIKIVFINAHLYVLKTPVKMVFIVDTNQFVYSLSRIFHEKCNILCGLKKNQIIGSQYCLFVFVC